jgi:hypothetical protein
MYIGAFGIKLDATLGPFICARTIQIYCLGKNENELFQFICSIFVVPKSVTILHSTVPTYIQYMIQVSLYFQLACNLWLEKN